MVEGFINWLTYEKRYSKHTISSYKNDLDQFVNFLESNFEISEPREVKSTFIKSWIVFLIESKYSTTSVNRKLVSVNSFFKYLLKEGEIQKNPASNIQGPKKPKRIVKYLEEEELVGVLERFEFEDSFEGARDKLIIELLYGTGIRLSELIGLEKNWVDLRKKVIKVLGKRNKERIIPINDTLINTIQIYLSKISEIMQEQTSKYLLLTSRGKKLYPMLVYRTVKKYIEEYANRTGISPHALRHSFATHLLKQGGRYKCY
jgi:integrase/recombinase XerC